MRTLAVKLQTCEDIVDHCGKAGRQADRRSRGNHFNRTARTSVPVNGHWYIEASSGLKRVLN